MSTRRWRYAPALAVIGVLLLSAAWAASDNDPFSSGLDLGAGAEGGAAPGGAAQPQAQADSPVRSAALLRSEQRIEHVLGEPTVLDFDETPLGEVVAYLADYHKISIELDAQGLEALGLSTDTPVTCHRKGIQLRSALGSICRPLELACTIRDEALLITSQDADQSYLITRAYDVADLVVFQDEKGERYDDFDSLIEVLTMTIEPDSWAEVGGCGQICPAQLGRGRAVVVTQTYAVHCRIVELLKQIDWINRTGQLPEDPPVRPRPASQPMMPGPVGAPGTMAPAGGGGMGGMGGGGMM